MVGTFDTDKREVGQRPGQPGNIVMFRIVTAGEPENGRGDGGQFRSIEIDDLRQGRSDSREGSDRLFGVYAVCSEQLQHRRLRFGRHVLFGRRHGCHEASEGLSFRQGARDGAIGFGFSVTRPAGPGNDKRRDAVRMGSGKLQSSFRTHRVAHKVRLADAAVLHHGHHIIDQGQAIGVGIVRLAAAAMAPGVQGYGAEA